MSYDLVVVILGLAFLGAAALPRLIGGTSLSLPIVYVAVGLALPLLWPETTSIDPIRYGAATERITEPAVIVSASRPAVRSESAIWSERWR